MEFCAPHVAETIKCVKRLNGWVQGETQQRPFNDTVQRVERPSPGEGAGDQSNGGLPTAVDPRSRWASNPLNCRSRRTVDVRVRILRLAV